MSQCLTTIVAPLDPADVVRAQASLDRMGNPADPALHQRLARTDADGQGTHFLSLHALPSFQAGRAHLLMEFSADGTPDAAIDRIVAAVGTELATIFALADDRGATDLGVYLKAHVVRTGHALGQSPGLAHSGSPGLTVGRIREDAELAKQVSATICGQPGGMRALDRLDAVRSTLGPASPWLRPTDAAPPFAVASLPATIAAALISFVATFLWPFLVVLFAWMLACAVHTAGAREFDRFAWFHGLWFGAKTGVPVLLLVLVALAATLYARLRKLEASDWISERAPDRATLHGIVARENAGAQNHMVSLTELKAGWLRSFTLRLTFWGIATLGPMRYKPGYLGPIGTIHFARWVTVPGTRDVFFLSNYGGSWEAYLEDFITLAHLGLTGVWSNTAGFPRTRNLIFDGATDGERFKRFARQSMVPTRFWFSAYPDLITDEIRANAAIRRGLSGAMTEDEATIWLSHFGSTVRPSELMATSEIQSLVFGGLGFLPHAALSVWMLSGEVADARSWLREIAGNVAYNDGRRFRDDDRPCAIVQLGVSSSGLAALGLPPDALKTFPAAFLDDMAHPARSRILGDVGEDAPENWWWGQRPADVAVLIYAETADAFAALTAEVARIGARHGAKLTANVPMKDFDRVDNLEPFGFVDGGSQPAIRGTYKGLKNDDPLHIVEPGEFVLGYPDNRRNLPPGPSLAAIDDPANVLPVLGTSSSFATTSVNNARDLGANGTFLVIRHLEQDPDAFQGYCDVEAARLKHRLGPPYAVSPDFIAAKLMGRWRNGSPLVRAPYSASKTDWIIEDNGFELGREDPEGLRCPFGAHIRRANPRDSLDPGSAAQVAISNRHRIMRVGRKYAVQPGQKPGLLFMALNADLERQFEFIQQTWLHGNVISLSCPITLSGEGDPILGTGGRPDIGFTVPSPDGPVKLAPTPRFVTMRGGGYFFMPGKRLIDYLCAERPAG